MVKEYVSSQQDHNVKAVLKVLGDNFALSSNPNSRKGGLIGLAAAAIALGKVNHLITSRRDDGYKKCLIGEDYLNMYNLFSA
jgi:vacuole morphology and inheritance protein 14